MAVYSRPGGWINPLVGVPGVGVGVAYAAAVATRAGARRAAATGWAAAAAVISAIVVALTWFAVFMAAISISCGDDAENCL